MVLIKRYLSVLFESMHHMPIKYIDICDILIKIPQG